MQIEHELRDRPLKPRKALLQHDEARARHPCGSFEIHLAERFAELVMLLGLEIHSRFFAPAAQLHIGAFVRTDRHIRRRQIRNLRQFLIELFLEPALFVFALLNLLLQPRHFGHQRLRLRLVFLGLGLPDQLGCLVPPRLRLLQPRQHRAQFRIRLKDFRAHGRKAAPLQPLVEGLRVVANGFDVMHGFRRNGNRAGPFWHVRP